MALDPVDIIRPASEAEMPQAPLAGNRSQSLQRLQVGLFGLAAMILLVSLANIVLNNARENEERVVPEAAPTVAADENEATVNDPLAAAGVVPDMPDEEKTDGRSSDAAPALQP